MISLPELRINNYFNLAKEKSADLSGKLSALEKIRKSLNVDKDKIYQVKSIINYETIGVNENGTENSISVNAKQVFGINLQKPILVQLGWKETTVIESLHVTYKQFILESDYQYCIRFDDAGNFSLFHYNAYTKGFTYLIPIKYVHQLQNIIFSLMNTELSL